MEPLKCDTPGSFLNKRVFILKTLQEVKTAEATVSEHEFRVQGESSALQTSLPPQTCCSSSKNQSGVLFYVSDDPPHPCVRLEQNIPKEKTSFHCFFCFKLGV